MIQYDEHKSHKTKNHGNIAHLNQEGIFNNKQSKL